MPDVLHKMDAAGRAASDTADHNREASKLDNAKSQIVQVMRKLVALSAQISKFGQDGDEVIIDMADKLSMGSGQRVAKLLARGHQVFGQQNETI
jgi:ABC-type transport system involved in cytochrome bd biosynthesis fused ATPase/permease subunit